MTPSLIVRSAGHILDVSSWMLQHGMSDWSGVILGELSLNYPEGISGPEQIVSFWISGDIAEAFKRAEQQMQEEEDAQSL